MGKKELLYDEIEVGLELPSFTYELTKDTIIKYAKAVEDENPLYISEEEAKKSEYGSLIGPPTIAAIYSLQSVLDARPGGSGIHAKQEYKFIKPAKPGDNLITTTKVVDKYIKKDRKLLVFETTTKNQNGEEIVIGRSSCIWPK